MPRVFFSNCPRLQALRQRLPGPLRRHPIRWGVALILILACCIAAPRPCELAAFRLIDQMAAQLAEHPEQYDRVPQLDRCSVVLAELFYTPGPGETASTEQAPPDSLYQFYLIVKVTYTGATAYPDSSMPRGTRWVYPESWGYTSITMRGDGSQPDGMRLLNGPPPSGAYLSDTASSRVLRPRPRYLTWYLRHAVPRSEQITGVNDNFYYGADYKLRYVI